MKKMTNLDKPPQRNRLQVVNIIKDRMESARRNSETIQKQIEHNEALSHTSSNVSKQVHTDLMEVTEELDEDDNVLSSKVENFDKAVDEMTDVLKKHSIIESKPLGNHPAPPVPSAVTEEVTKRGNEIMPTFATSSNVNEVVTKLPLGKPTVLHPKAAEKLLDELSEDDESIIEISTGGGNTNITRDIRHNLNDIGPIVASLDLEEDEEEEWSEDEEDDENEYGMNNIRDQMEEEYIREMEALAGKHGMRNLGPNPTVLPEIVPKSVLITTNPGLSRPTDSKEAIDASSVVQLDNQKPKKSKGVRFAENLDISPHPASTPFQSNTNAEQHEPSRAVPAPLTDEIVEKPFITTLPVPSFEQPTQEMKVSRFKAAKMANAGISKTKLDIQAGTNFQEDAPNLNKLKSHRPLSDAAASLKEEFGLYSKRVKDSQDQVDMTIFETQTGDDDHEDGVHEPTRKVSRFKAARLGLHDDE